MKQHYLLMVRSAESALHDMLTRVNTDPESLYSGGISDTCRITEPGASPAFVLNLCTLYVCPESRYFRDARLLSHIESSCDMMERVMHEDGTWDFLATNYYTPATFEIQAIARGYRCLKNGSEGTVAEQSALSRLYRVLERLGEGCLNGGFHTPNHRWVESASLLMLSNICVRSDFAAKAERYLAEGIDCDEYGEFTERSMGCYNAVNVNSLMIMAEEGNRPELYEYVKKTLDLSFSYLDWDGSLFTKNSRRQDADNERFHPAATWYYLYLWAGYLFGNKKYLRFASDMMEENIASGLGVPACLWLYEMFPALKELDTDLTDAAIESSYTRFFPKSGILRLRRERFTATLIAGKPDFLYLKFGNKELTLRMCASFFAVAQFAPERIEKTDGGYSMYFKGHGEYKGQFAEPPTTSDWFQMDHAARPVLHSCDLEFLLDLTPREDGFDLRIRVFNTPRVPFKLEFCIPEGTRLETNNFVSDVTAGGSMVIKSGNMRLTDVSTGASVRVGGLFATHLYHTSMRGSIPSKPGCFALCATDTSPIDRALSFRFNERTRAPRMDDEI